MEGLLEREVGRGVKREGLSSSSSSSRESSSLSDPSSIHNNHAFASCVNIFSFIH